MLAAVTTFMAEFSPSTVTYSALSVPSATNFASCSMTSLCGVIGYAAMTSGLQSSAAWAAAPLPVMTLRCA
jgi:hypothetical protein